MCSISHLKLLENQEKFQTCREFIISAIKNDSYRNSVPLKNNAAKKQKGFTLIELVITMVILGILVVVAWPRFGGSGGYDEYAYQTRLIGVLRGMQMRAMNDTALNRCFQVNFDNTNDAFGPPTLNYLSNLANTCLTTIDVENVLTGNDRQTVLHMYGLSEELQSDNIDMVALNSVGTEVTFIGFTNLGEPLTGDAGNDNCASGCSVEFRSAVSVAKVCVEPQGYIHAGECNG